MTPGKLSFKEPNEPYLALYLSRELNYNSRPGANAFNRGSLHHVPFEEILLQPYRSEPAALGFVEGSRILSFSPPSFTSPLLRLRFEKLTTQSARRRSLLSLSTRLPRKLRGPKNVRLRSSNYLQSLLQNSFRSQITNKSLSVLTSRSAVPSRLSPEMK